MSGIKIDSKIFAKILQQKMGEDSDEKAQLREHILWKMRQIVEPDLSCFNIVLRSWCRSGSPDAAERTWHIFQLLISSRLHPDNEFLTTLIPFLSSTGDLKMLNRAEYLLKKINDNGFASVSPDLRFFVAVTKGWINIGHAQRAEKLLFLRNDLYVEKKLTKLMPIPVNYDVIMHAYIKAGKILKATKFISKVDELVEQKQLPVAPELRTYRSLLNAWKRWSKSYHAEKHQYISRLEAKIAHLVKNS
jgi:pentatricopeptide repeat protein